MFFRVVKLCEYADALKCSDNFPDGIAIERVVHFYRIAAGVSVANPGYC
jgi:hypothetical protein